MDGGLFHPCFFPFLAISISILNIIFTPLVFVLFLHPFLDFDSFNKSTLICLYAGVCV